MPTLAQKLPYTHPFAGGYPYRGSQRLPSDPDALTYLSAVAAADGAPVEVGVAMAVDDFFRGTKADGTFGALKSAALLCGARTLAGALVPLVGTAPTNVADGFVAGDYTRGGATPGLQGDGTSYLDSGRADDDDPQDDRHLAVYVTAGTTNNKTFIGNAVTSPVFSISAVFWHSTLSIRSLIASNSTLLTAGTYSGASSTFAGTVRTGATAAELRALGESDTDTAASTGVNNINHYVFARNDAGTASLHSDARLAFYSIGEALDLEALDTRVTALVTAIGAAV